MSDDHPHHAAPDVGTLRERQRRVLWAVLVANLAFMGAEVAGGFAFSSLALLSDAAHMASDVSALGIALVAQALLRRPTSDRHTYGLQRAEVIGAQASGVLLVATSGWIVFEAFQRFGDPADVDGGGLLAVATVGLAVNVVSAVLLARVRGQSLNMHGAFLHMAADTAGSVGAIAAGVAVVAWGADWVDPAASIAMAVLVLWAAWRLLRDATVVLLEGAPKGLDAARIREAIAAEEGVDEVHHVHLWSLASDTPALSAHLVMAGEITMHEAQERGEVVRASLARRFGITHATLELECHPCDDPELSADGYRDGT